MNGSNRSASSNLVISADTLKLPAVGSFHQRVFLCADLRPVLLGVTEIKVETNDQQSRPFFSDFAAIFIRKTTVFPVRTCVNPEQVDTCVNLGELEPKFQFNVCLCHLEWVLGAPLGRFQSNGPA